jgi:UDP-glucose 4-epimerase
MNIRGVMVTGATTPIGERLVRNLLRDPGVGNVLAVAFEAPDVAVPFRVGERLVYKQVDLSRSRQARNLLFGPARELGVEVIIHTAMHRDARHSGGRVHAQNVETLRSLLDLAERHPTIRRLVFKSAGEVYQVQHDLPIMIQENHPLNMNGGAPQWVRDRVEADINACTRMGLTRLEIAVLRCAEVLARGVGSQLFDYLEAPFCLRPAGFDPMMNLLSLDDCVRALELGARSFGVQGVFNVPGKDTLPLSACIRHWGRLGVPVPGAALAPAYKLRKRLRGHDFSYGMNKRRFHYCSVLDGNRASEVLGYVPEKAIDWPRKADPVG